MGVTINLSFHQLMSARCGTRKYGADTARSKAQHKNKEETMTRRQFINHGGQKAYVATVSTIQTVGRQTLSQEQEERRLEQYLDHACDRGECGGGGDRVILWSANAVDGVSVF